MKLKTGFFMSAFCLASAAGTTGCLTKEKEKYQKEIIQADIAYLDRKGFEVVTPDTLSGIIYQNNRICHDALKKDEESVAVFSICVDHPRSGERFISSGPEFTGTTLSRHP